MAIDHCKHLNISGHLLDRLMCVHCGLIPIGQNCSQQDRLGMPNLSNHGDCC